MVKTFKGEAKFATQLYNSCCNKLFVWNEQIEQLKGRRRKLAKFDEDEYSALIPAKLMSCARENYAFKQLREAASVPDLEKSALALQLIEEYSKTNTKVQQNGKQSEGALPNNPEWCYCSTINIDTKVNIIRLLKLKKWSYKSVCSKLELQFKQVRLIKKHFDDALIAESKQWKEEKHKIRWILQNRQIEWLSEYFSRMNGKRITAKTVKLDIINQFPEIRNISLSTVARTLKQRVGMSYKKLHRRETGTLKKANIIKYIDSAWIIQTLSNTGWELIYFDGFAWDSRRSQFTDGVEEAIQAIWSCLMANWMSALSELFQKNDFTELWESAEPPTAEASSSLLKRYESFVW